MGRNEEQKKKDREYSKQWRKDNSEKVKVYRKMRRKLYPEKIKQQARAASDKIRFDGNRQKALERDGFKCQDCGMTEKEQIELFGRGLTVDHLDCKGVCSKVKNHKLENLRTLCHRCHPIKDKKMYMKRRWGELVEQDDSGWKYPRIRYLVEDEIKKGFGVQESKRIVSKNTGMGFSLVDHRYYMKKTTQKTSEAKERNPAHYCMSDGCKKFLGHRGFCSTKCHDSHYDGYELETEQIVI